MLLNECNFENTAIYNMSHFICLSTQDWVKYYFTWTTTDYSNMGKYGCWNKIFHLGSVIKYMAQTLGDKKKSTFYFFGKYQQWA